MKQTQNNYTKNTKIIIINKSNNICKIVMLIKFKNIITFNI